MTEFFEEDTYYIGPRLNTDMVSQAEEYLGFRLPLAYVELLLQRNGGVPRLRCLPTEFATSWAPDHIEISAVCGIGGEWGIDSATGLGNADMIAEWGYPDIGLVICDTPSAGHDAVMLDYSECGAEGEPAVAYIDEDRVPRRIASSFDDFLARLAACPQPSDGVDVD